MIIEKGQTKHVRVMIERDEDDYGDDIVINFTDDGHMTDENLLQVTTRYEDQDFSYAYLTNGKSIFGFRMGCLSDEH